MYRRNILQGVAAAAGALFAVSGARASAGKPDKMKVAYHLSDLDKAGFVVGNIQNHFDGVGGPEFVTIVLVVHGPALKAFHSPSSNSELRQKLAKLSKNGLALEACSNTMKAQNVNLKDLLPGFVAAEQGGVVRLAELQAQGYVYLKP
jgi:intracellular sulfur oxidation DsrE/DsrF family protein